MKAYDYLIVGSGLFGATFAYLATQNGKKCLVIEKRSHIGGNCYCENINGITVHRYGPHIFHTNKKEIWDFVNNKIELKPYVNEPIAKYKDKIYHLPFNMNTFYELWGCITPEEAKEKIKSQQVEIEEPQNLEEQALKMVGGDIYEKLIKGYTEKQWGRDCKELPPFIVKRLPLRFIYDNNYYNDKYQGIPDTDDGYNELFNVLLADCDVVTGVDFLKKRKVYENIADKIVFTGQIDSYFDYCYGELKYRSLTWDTELLEGVSNFQGNAVVNYTGKEVDFTRLIEYKHFRGIDTEDTVISKEFPCEWNKSVEPFYPINDEKNNTIYAKYKELAEKQENVIFGGRLGEYKYFDMAPTIERAIEAWNKEKINT